MSIVSANRCGFSTALLARIDRFLNRRYVEPGRLAGVVYAIERRGEYVHTGVMGMADRERATPLRKNTIFRLYSMTKPLTSIAFMMLVEEGLVSLEDPVHAYIPTWRDLGVWVAGTAGAFQTKPVANPMRIIDLLRHTSGLTYGFQLRTNVDAAYRDLGIGTMDTCVPLRRTIELLAGIPLEFSPGEAWNYSVSTDVLGYLIGILSGMPFETFLRTRILAPLGMSDTDFYVPAGKQARLAACYAVAPAGNVVLQDDPASSPFLAPPAFVSGGGGLVGTVDDYLKFCRMLLNGGAIGGERIISPRTLAFMTMNHLPGGRELTAMSRSMFSESIYDGLGFGLGFGVVLDRAKTLTPGNVGEYFWGGAASTAFWIDPVADLAVVFLAQLIPSSTYPIRRQLRTLVYAAMEE